MCRITLYNITAEKSFNKLTKQMYNWVRLTMSVKGKYDKKREVKIHIHTVYTYVNQNIYDTMMIWQCANHFQNSTYIEKRLHN